MFSRFLPENITFWKMALKWSKESSVIPSAKLTYEHL